MSGNRFVTTLRDAESERHLIEKRSATTSDGQKLALVISEAGLLELLSPLAFALAAALEGIDVAIYFQGPAVKVLTTGFKGRLKGLGRPFSVFPRRGLAKTGHVAPHEKLRQLQELGATFYVCGGSMEHFKVRRNDLAFAGVIVAEYLTFMEVMSEADIRFFLQ